MKHPLFRLLIALTVTAVVSIACSTDAVKEQKQIATACASITAAVNTIAAGAETGKVSKADAAKALAVAKPTAAFCEPKPVAHLSAVDYAALLSAAADLATRKEAIR